MCLNQDVRDGAVSGYERPGLPVSWGSRTGGGRTLCRKGSAAIERPTFKSQKLFVKSVSMGREKASVTEGCDQTAVARLR